MAQDDLGRRNCYPKCYPSPATRPRSAAVAVAITSQPPHADHGVPRRDREGEETSARLRNGDTQFGDLMCRQGDMTTTVRAGSGSPDPGLPQRDQGQHRAHREDHHRQVDEPEMSHRVEVVVVQVVIR